MNRNDVFLEAMGLGPQWRLRQGPAVVGGEAVADDAVADAMAAVQGVTPDGMSAAPSMPSMPATAPASSNPSRPSMSANGGAAAGYPAPAMRGPDVLPDSPRPAAPSGADGGAPVAPPPARAVSQGAEDTSWFDDAPAAPSARPALKSPAPAKPAPPARPPANGGAAPGTGDADGDSYAWFDAVPATPLAKPQRPGRPPQSASEAVPAPDGMPDDSMPWFDDAPPPSFDAAFDGLYGEDGQYGQEEQGVSAAAIARMDWTALRAAVQTCTRCPLGRERAAAVPGRGPEQAPWLVLATAPDADDEAQQRALAGAPGQLLDNMLKAIKVAPEGEAYVTTLVKCRARDGRAPSGDELSACRPYLERSP